MEFQVKYCSSPLQIWVHKLRVIDDYRIEVLISLATVMATYSLAGKLHLSGPIAVVLCRSSDRRARPNRRDERNDSLSGWSSVVGAMGVVAGALPLGVPLADHRLWIGAGCIRSFRLAIRWGVFAAAV